MKTEEQSPFSYIAIPDILAKIDELAKEKANFIKEEIVFLLENKDSFLLSYLLKAASLLRHKYFTNRVQLHIINNIRNGYCPEDCHYCAQRTDSEAETIPSYSYKSEEEILEEAHAAWSSGAYRYCLVSAGRGPSKTNVARLTKILASIKAKYPDLELCLSAGLVHNPEDASKLKEAGLDRYNHNLNTSAKHYKNICSTHSYQDRVNTLKTMKKAGIDLCSGMIVGMGESTGDIADLLLYFSQQKIASIPINFFIPIASHSVKNNEKLRSNKCLCILALTRLMNPSSEVRLAAGRELYLADHMQEALLAANSLFVSGYLNVKGFGCRGDHIALKKIRL